MKESNNNNDDDDDDDEKKNKTKKKRTEAITRSIEAFWTTESSVLCSRLV